MLSIIAFNPIPFIFAVIIGLVTAWWVWRSPAETQTGDEIEDLREGEAAGAEDPIELEDTPEVQSEPEADSQPEPEREPEPEPVPEPVPAVKPAETAAPIAAAATGLRATRKPVDVSEFDESTKITEDRPAIAAAVGPADDLSRIKGIGPKLQELCNSLGIERFDQIGAWTSRDVAAVDQHLGNFTGRITRDEWIVQARLLAEGRVSEHAAQFRA